MFFARRLLIAFSLMIASVILAPKLVFADAAYDSCIATCTTSDTLANCQQTCTPSPTPTAATPTSSTADDKVDRTAQGFDDIVGANDKTAIGLIFINISPECKSSGQCSLDDVLQEFVNLSIFILGIIGSLVLLMFIYGGFLWITSRGEAKRVEKGREVITQAVIGFAIVVLSYSMINFLIAALAGDKPGATLEETIDNAADGSASLKTGP